MKYVKMAVREALNGVYFITGAMIAFWFLERVGITYYTVVKNVCI